MYKASFFLALVITLNSVCNVCAMDLSATSAVLYEPVAGRYIIGKNENAKMPMASTTKIATCITAIEYGNLEDVVTVSQKAADIEGSSIWLEAGENMSVENLLYGLMLSSGNDAAVAIAEHIGVSTEKFAQLMNKIAYKAGAYNTNFTNPSGLDDENHYTTALDLAKITSYALKNSVFSEIVATKEKTIPWEGHEWNRKLKNHNKLLNLYDGCTGVKTGFTKKSGRCLVSSAERNGVTLVAVTLKAPDDWNDHIKMFDYGFSELTDTTVIEEGSEAGKVAVVNGVNDFIECIASEQYRVPLLGTDNVEMKTNLMHSIEAPVEKGTVVGYTDIILNGTKIKRINLIAQNNCAKKFVPTFTYYVRKLYESMFKNKNTILN